MQGKMVGDNSCLGEFTNMGNKIKAKICGAISHVEVPFEILRSPGGERKEGAETIFMTGGADLCIRDEEARPANNNI